ncbi:MAG: gamma-glutamylcyclotransferase family protein [Pirellulaceae bacterium]
MLYFAYGSNLDRRVMRAKGVAYNSRRAAQLRDFALRFDKRALRPGSPAGVGYANIVPAVGQCVEGALYELSDSALPPLDLSERHPHHYHRIDVRIVVDGAEQAAFAYRAREDKTGEGLSPSRDYLDRLLAGGDLFSPKYFARLQGVATFTTPCTVCAVEVEVGFDRRGDSVRSRCLTCGAVDVV